MAEKSKTKAEPKAQAQAEEKVQPMSKFVDELLLKGGSVDDIAKKTAAEASKRNVTWGSKRAHVLAHIRFRIKNNFPIIYNDKESTVAAA